MDLQEKKHARESERFCPNADLFFQKIIMSWTSIFLKHYDQANWGQQSQPVPQHNFKSKKIKEETYINDIKRRKGIVSPVAHKSAIVDEVDGGVV